MRVSLCLVEKKWEGVEVGLDAVEAHTKEDRDRMRGEKRRLSSELSMSSNEGVPCETFNGGMKEIETWVREGQELCQSSHFWYRNGSSMLEAVSWSRARPL
ncbi:hypothetical protein Ancab_021878 [Ancistrocladus abbreviatus]